MGLDRLGNTNCLRLIATSMVAAVLTGCTGTPESGSGAPQESPVKTATTTTSTEAEPTEPNPFSGDTTWIAYQTNRTGGESVWLVHPDGSEDHQLETGLPYDYLLPDWSPDGSRIVFTTRGGGTEPLYEYDLASQKTRQLFACKNHCLGDDEPSYSPDGTTVAFVRALAPFVEGAPSDCGIWLGDRQTGRVRRLTSNTQPPCDREYFVRWSPDGKRLAYQRELALPNGGLTTAVFTLATDGTGERRLTKSDLVAGEPAYSPDGEWIVFSTHPLNVFETSSESQLYRIHPDGTGMEQLTRFANIRATQPRYSPDGKWILFTAVNSFDERHLWAIPATRGLPVVIADLGAIYTHGVWQPTR